MIRIETRFMLATMCAPGDSCLSGFRSPCRGAARPLIVEADERAGILAVELGLAREGERRGLEPRGAGLRGRAARLPGGRTRGRGHVAFEEEKGHEGEAHRPTFLFLQGIGIIVACMIITVTVMIMDVNTVENGYIA